MAWRRREEVAGRQGHVIASCRGDNALPGRTGDVMASCREAETAGRRGDGARDQGMVTAFVIVFATALVFVSGLVVDGGRMLAEHREVNNLADSAARAGAQAISEDAVRRGDDANRLDPAEAVDLACAFLSRADHPCGGGTSVTVQGNEVFVTVTGSIDLLLLAGADRPVRGEGSACVAVGIDVGVC